MNSASVIRFDRFELRPAQQLLLRDGEPVRLGPRAFDLLVVLVGRAGQLMSKDELLDAVWPGLVVEENNIATQVVALRKALDSGLIATVPGRGYRFTGQVQLQGSPSPSPDAAASPPAVAPGAPYRRAVTSLRGRADDLARLQALLQSPGACSLVGPGGVGKTALARVVFDAASQARHWIDLATLADGGQLLQAVRRAAGLDQGDAPAAVAAALKRDALLVLDNAEHLIDDVAALVAALLRAAPDLRVLVTSQLPLSIAGEHVYRLGPLELPAADMSDEQALATPALELLLDRLHAANARWRLSADTAPLLRRLCAALDGLPLALEMAAARAATLGLAAVCDGLDERFDLLRRGRRDAPDRQQTLLATLLWSERLLDLDEQRLLHGLGVFVGDFSVGLAVAVAPPDSDRWDTVDRLATLVDRSLVMASDSDPPRYRLLESTRLHAMQSLQASGEAQAVHARHAAALAALVASAQDTPESAADAAQVSAALAEIGHLPQAMAWARQHDAPLAVRLAVQSAVLATFTSWRADLLQELAACEPLLPQCEAAVQAQWWTTFATQSMFARSPRASEAARQAISWCRQVGDDWRQLWALIALARCKPAPDEELSAALQEMRALLKAHPNWRAQAHAVGLGTLALAAERAGELQAALQHRLAELALVHQTQDASLQRHLGVAANNVAHVLHLLGRDEEALQRLQAYLAHEPFGEGHNAMFARVTMLRILFAQQRFDEALAMAEGLLATARRQHMHWMLEVLTLGAAMAGRHHAAAQLLGHVKQLLQARGLASDAQLNSDLVRAEALVRTALNDDALTARLQLEGRSMDAEQADRLLLARPCSHDVSRQAAAPAPP